MQFDDSFSDRCKESVTKNVKLMLQSEPHFRPSAAAMLEEFSCNFELTQQEPPENVHIHRVFNQDSESAESMRKISSLQGKEYKKNVSNIGHRL